MRQSVIMKAFIALAAIAMLAACASKPKPSASFAPEPAAGQQQEIEPSPWGDTGRPIPPSLQQEFANTVGDRVFFDLDSHLLKPEARDTLTRQADWLTQHPSVRVLIAGNCDERGTREYNFALGGRRAEAVRRYLTSQGVSGARLRTVSYGKEKPIDLSGGEEGWARNRNAQTVLIDLGPA